MGIFAPKTKVPLWPQLLEPPEARQNAPPDMSTETGRARTRAGERLSGTPAMTNFVVVPGGNAMPNIHQTHHLNAAPVTIFSHLTEAQLLDTWWTSHAVSDPRKGGAFRYEWKFAPGSGMKDQVQQGNYLECDPNHSLAYHWDVDGTQTTVRFELSLDGIRTKLRLFHDDCPSDEAAQRLAQGWASYFANLARILEGKSDRRAEMGLIVGQTA